MAIGVEFLLDQTHSLKVNFRLGPRTAVRERAEAIAWPALDVDRGVVEIRATMIRIKGQGLRIKEKPKSEAGWRIIELRDVSLGSATGMSPRTRSAYGRHLDGRSRLSARAAADQLGHAKASMTQDHYFGRQVAKTGAAQLLEAMQRPLVKPALDDENHA